MKKLIFIFLLIFLVSCSVRQPLQPAKVSEPQINESVNNVVEEPVIAKKDELQPSRTVEQTGKRGTIKYGLTENNTLLYVKKTGADWEYHYEQSKLTEITGPQDLEFLYFRGKLAAIDLGASKLQFEYNNKNQLVEIKGGQFPISINYDSKDRVSSILRGVSGKTDIEYDNKDRISSLTRGPKILNVYYDKENRVRAFDGDDTKFIIGYWKDSKLISLTGMTFGLGLSVSYGPDLPPTEALIVNKDDDSRFVTGYTDTVYSIVDEYLYCKYIRRLKSVPFEGQSYAFYVNYFNGTLTDYFMMNYVCIPFEE